jgi:hypothetical protein
LRDVILDVFEGIKKRRSIRPKKKLEEIAHLEEYAKKFAVHS